MKKFFHYIACYVLRLHFIEHPEFEGSYLCACGRYRSTTPHTRFRKRRVKGTFPLSFNFRRIYQRVGQGEYGHAIVLVCSYPFEFKDEILENGKDQAYSRQRTHVRVDLWLFTVEFTHESNHWKEYDGLSSFR